VRHEVAGLTQKSGSIHLSRRAHFHVQKSAGPLNVKRMLIVSFVTHGDVHHESIPQGQTVSQHYYANILRHLREHVWLNQPEQWTAADLYLDPGHCTCPHCFACA